MTNCPKCGVDISDTFQEAEPDVGIMGSGYYCDACDEFVDSEYEPHETDVAIFPSPPSTPEERGQCPHCLGRLEMGYGLAGGGIGPYTFCASEACGKYFVKYQDPEV